MAIQAKVSKLAWAKNCEDSVIVQLTNRHVPSLCPFQAAKGVLPQSGLRRRTLPYAVRSCLLHSKRNVGMEISWRCEATHSHQPGALLESLSRSPCLSAMHSGLKLQGQPVQGVSPGPAHACYSTKRFLDVKCRSLWFNFTAELATMTSKRISDRRVKVK